MNLSFNHSDMIIPRKIEQKQVTTDYGRFVISPLEKGYGETLGSVYQDTLLRLSGDEDKNISPVRRVKYHIKPKIDDRCKTEALTLEIWTDGTLHPEKAL